MVIVNKKSSIAKNTKKISSRKLLENFLKYLYKKRLLNSSQYDSIINEYLNKKKIQPPTRQSADPPPPPLTTINEDSREEDSREEDLREEDLREEEDSQEYREIYGEPFEPTEEQKRNLDRVIERSSQMQTSRQRTQVTKEHMEEAKVFDQNNNFKITFLKEEISKNYSNLNSLLLPNGVTFTNNKLSYIGDNTAKRSLIEKFNKSHKYQSVSVSESDSEKLNSILSNNVNYLFELNQLLNYLKEPSSYKSGGKPAKYKSTGITVFILYKNKKYNRAIYVKDKGKTKYCKINNEYILLSKLKVIG
jgi:hypothetical protein